MNLPILYKLTSTGKILEWEISVDDNVITVVHGQQDGKKQTDVQTILVGKNIGRSNETTPAQQAELEAKAKWTKKVEKDYRESIEELSDEKTSSTGGFLPMLAQKWKDHKDKLEFPCYIQRKYDGIRCISMRNDGIVTLWSRTGKPITTMPHVIEDLQHMMLDGDIFDGELYSHEDNFNAFTGAIRREVNTDTSITSNIKYVIYDAPRIKGLNENSTFEARIAELSRFIAHDDVYVCDTILVDNIDQALEYFTIFIADGFEGGIFRNRYMMYEQKRSMDLLKYKEFEDAEFKIIGIEEGKGRLAGFVGSFILDNGDGQTFNAKLHGDTHFLKLCFQEHDLWQDKMMTVKFFGRSEYNIPRHPVGVAIRDYE